MVKKNKLIITRCCVCEKVLLNSRWRLWSEEAKVEVEAIIAKSENSYTFENVTCPKCKTT